MFYDLQLPVKVSGFFAKFPHCYNFFSFQDHNRVAHDGGNTFDCQFCGKKFYRKDFRQLHIDGVHLNIKKFKCNKVTNSIPVFGRYSLSYNFLEPYFRPSPYLVFEPNQTWFTWTL